MKCLSVCNTQKLMDGFQPDFDVGYDTESNKNHVMST